VAAYNPPGDGLTSGASKITVGGVAVTVAVLLLVIRSYLSGGGVFALGTVGRGR
jgi:hypothetical protein